MKLFYSVLLIGGTLFSISGWSGQEKGNGAAGLVCNDADRKKTVELYDLYEGRTIRQIVPALGIGDQWKPKLEKAISRLDRLNPERSARYREYFKTFIKDAKFVSRASLNELPDLGPISIPENCSVVQIAAQSEPTLPGDSRYLIDQDLWNLLSPEGKAGLVLHELIYREVSSKVPTLHVTSKYVRFFNTMMLSNQIEVMSLKTYMDLARTSFLPDIQSHDRVGLKLFGCSSKIEIPCKIEFWNENQIKSGEIEEGTDYFVETSLLGKKVRARLSRIFQTARSNKQYATNPSGKVMEYQLSEPGHYEFSNPIQLRFDICNDPSRNVQIWDHSHSEMGGWVEISTGLAGWCNVAGTPVGSPQIDYEMYFTPARWKSCKMILQFKLEPPNEVTFCY